MKLKGLSGLGLALLLLLPLGALASPLPQPVITVTAVDATANEAGLDAGAFAITRSGSTTSELTVQYTVGGSAEAGTDYRALAGSVTIRAGQRSVVVTVTPVDDGAIEGSETVVVTLSRGTRYNTGVPFRAMVTIGDNDLTPIFRSVALYPKDAAQIDEFGRTVALDGDWLVASSARATHVFRHNGSNWVEGQQFPFAGPVAISGDTLVIGSYLDGGSDVVRVFARSGSGWVEQATLLPDESGSNNFGSAVAISGDTLLVGAPTGYWEENPTSSSVYVFVREGTRWTRQAKLQLGSGGDQFGYAVALDGETAVIGARLANAAYVFVRDRTNWVQEARLEGDFWFGASVAIDGDTAVVGSPHDGTGHVFVRQGHTWTQQGVMDGASGWSVAIEGDRAVLGLPMPAVNGAFLFARHGTNWNEQDILTPGAHAPSQGADRYGVEVAMSQRWIALGAAGVDMAGVVKSGAVYMLDLQAEPTITVAATDLTAWEGGSDAAEFTITRMGDTSGELTVHYWLDGSAVNGKDYEGVPGSVTLPAGQTRAAVKINPLNDGESEPTETVVLMLRAGAAYMVSSVYQAVLSIEDKDQFLLPAIKPTITVIATENTSEDGSVPGQFRISRTGETTAPLRVSYSVGGWSGAWPGEDYHELPWDSIHGRSIVIPAGQSFATVEIIPIDDNAAEGPQVMTCSIYEDESYVIGSPERAELTIEDNDEFLAAPVVTVMASPSECFELGGNVGIFTVARNGSTNSALTVSYAISGTAVNGSDYESLEGSAAIPVGARSIEIAVRPLADNEREATETVILTVASNANYRIGSPGGSAAIWVISDNGPEGVASHSLAQKLYNPAPVIDNWRHDIDRTLAISANGNTIVVGSRRDDSAGTNAGAVYVYARTGAGWSLEQKLTASDAGVYDLFGSSVALAADTLVVGAERRSQPVLVTGGSINWRAKGAVYVFERNGTVWSEKQKLTADDTTWGNDHFGASVALNGETLVVGAPERAEDGSQGAVYVFERNGSTWIQRQRILNRVTQCGEYFGTSLALGGEVLVIGAPGYGAATAEPCSAVYVFGRDGTTWTERARLTGNTVQKGTYFGSSLALQGETLVVGAASENLGPTWPDPTWPHFGTGAAYVFVQNGTAWNLQQRLTLAEAVPSHYFGWSLALAAETLAIGNRCISGNDLLPGTVHVFQRDGTVWNREQILQAREGAVADLFGQRIALSGRTLVATSGAADEATYVYELDGEKWSTWKGVDVGTLSARGGESFANGTFTLAGAGADIWGQGDEFHFVYRQWTGDGEIVGRVTDLEETEGWAKAGVMFRESLDPTARNALAFVTPSNGAGFQRRATLNGGTEFTHGAALARAPSWVKLVRNGNNFTAYHSVDGVKWMFGGSAIIDMPGTLYVGLAVTSHRDGALCTATFDNVSVTDRSTAAVSTLPFISDVKRTTGDVMELTIHGEPGKTYKVEASTNLVDWRSLAAQLNASGSFITKDVDAANHPARFYRVVLVE